MIGQETQGPGGFFMALRSIKVMQELLDDVIREPARNNRDYLLARAKEILG